MKAHCPACHAVTEVEAQPGEAVQCSACGCKFRTPIPKGTARIGDEFPDLVAALGGGLDRLEGVLIDAVGGPDVFAAIKARAVEKFGEFIAELESDTAIDLEAIGRALTELPTLEALAAPSEGAAPAPAESVYRNPTVLADMAIVLRQELDEALDGLAGEIAAEIADAESPWPAIRLTGSDIGSAEVAVLDGDEWVTVIQDSGAAVSHIVEANGVDALVAAARESADTDAPGDDAGDDARPIG